MKPGLRLAVVAIVLAAVGIPAALLTRASDEEDPGPAPQPSLPTCFADAPPPVETPAWLPEDLPFPEGSYVTQDLPEVQGIRRATLVARAGLDDFVRYVLEEWPKRGWTLGRGDREAFEAEAPFNSPDGRVGQFRARQIYCDPDITDLLIAFADQIPGPAPSP